MTSLTTFHLFPDLPTELRLKIYSHAFPQRILQLGLNFPFPFLPKCFGFLKYKPDYVKPALKPIPTSFPALFHTARESRALCLSIYVPFSYSYIHPNLDTLYISRRAGQILSSNLGSQHGSARPPLYPTALLDRIAIECDIADLPLESIRGDRYLFCSTVFDNSKALIQNFGTPKELLLVRGAIEPGYDTLSPGPMRGWESIELFDSGLPLGGSASDETAMLAFVTYSMGVVRSYNPWFQWRTPKVRFVKAKREGQVVLPDDTVSRLRHASIKCIAEWKDAEIKLLQREFDWDVDGNPYFIENMSKALERHGIQWKGKRRSE